MNTLDALLADLAETVGNAALDLDADAKERLAALEGRCIRIECARPNKVATLKVQRARIGVSEEAIGEADAVVRGSMAELIAWVAAGAPAEGAAVRIDGDREALAELMAAITPNFVNRLAGALSGSPGEDLLGALELAAAGVRSAAKGVAHAVKQGLGATPESSDPLGHPAPAFAALREGALQFALRVQELVKPPRADQS